MDLGTGLLGLVAGSGSNWSEGVEAYLRYACGSTLGRVEVMQADHQSTKSILVSVKRRHRSRQTAVLHRR